MVKQEMLEFLEQPATVVLIEGATVVHLCSLLDHKIYFQQGSKGFSIYFRFNSNVSESKDSAIGFDYKRTRYSPVFLSSQ